MPGRDHVWRLRCRNGDRVTDFLAAGEVAEIIVTLYPSSNVSSRGHRIRRDASSPNFPRFDVNGNTGENPGISPVKVPARNTVYHSPDYPSHVVLPLIPAL